MERILLQLLGINMTLTVLLWIVYARNQKRLKRNIDYYEAVIKDRNILIEKKERQALWAASKIEYDAKLIQSQENVILAHRELIQVYKHRAEVLSADIYNLTNQQPERIS